MAAPDLNSPLSLMLTVVGARCPVQVKQAAQQTVHAMLLSATAVRRYCPAGVRGGLGSYVAG